MLTLYVGVAFLILTLGVCWFLFTVIGDDSMEFRRAAKLFSYSFLTAVLWPVVIPAAVVGVAGYGLGAAIKDYRRTNES